MSDKIEPALTPGEWAEQLSVETRRPWATSDYSPHAMAALALYGQPFGFTRKDVNLLRSLHWNELAIPPFSGTDLSEQVRGIIDRIEALLPPETP